MNKRASGILLHISSLPSAFGIGDCGPEAYKFVDFLEYTKQSYWQILPLNPTDPALGNSPYSSISAFAANPLFISPELLVQEGFLAQKDIAHIPDFPRHSVTYEAVMDYKGKLLSTAFERFDRSNKEFKSFCSQQAFWLDDFALFSALKAQHSGQMWNAWPKELRDRVPAALDKTRKQNQERIEKEKFFQFLFFKQWRALKEYANQKGIQIVGDMPIYVTYDSADAWSNPSIFKLNKDKQPITVAGVPPDYFSQTGQLWGNPVYDWEALKKTGYSWWVERMKHSLSLFDIVRVDHFRGFVGFWEIPFGEKTAVKGKWAKAPADDFFLTLLKHCSSESIIAEDLGIITKDVKAIMDKFDFSGMKVLLFAFGGDEPMHPYLPHAYDYNCVVYTGTHDNNTIRGWFDNETTEQEKKKLFDYCGRNIPPDELHWELIRLAMMSVADTAIVPLQDVLGFGQDCRMNKPSTTTGNWQWRLLSESLTQEPCEKLRSMTRLYGRTE